MFGKMGAVTLLMLAAAMPAQDAAAQDVLGGALFGGAAGAVIGGIAGGGRGAAIGAGIGAATGAIIAAEGQRRSGGYYSWRRGCYVERPDGAWVRVSARYCGPAEYVPAPSVAGDPIAYCMQRFRSYDPVSQTYLGFDGLRHPCP